MTPCGTPEVKTEKRAHRGSVLSLLSPPPPRGGGFLPRPPQLCRSATPAREGLQHLEPRGVFFWRKRKSQIGSVTKLCASPLTRSEMRPWAVLRVLAISRLHFFLGPKFDRLDRRPSDKLQNAHNRSQVTVKMSRFSKLFYPFPASPGRRIRENVPISCRKTRPP